MLLSILLPTLSGIMLCSISSAGLVMLVKTLPRVLAAAVAVVVARGAEGEWGWAREAWGR